MCVKVLHTITKPFEWNSGFPLTASRSGDGAAGCDANGQQLVYFFTESRGFSLRIFEKGEGVAGGLSIGGGCMDGSPDLETQRLEANDDIGLRCAFHVAPSCSLLHAPRKLNDRR
jgi:hypothetical protein